MNIEKLLLLPIILGTTNEAMQQNSNSSVGQKTDSMIQQTDSMIQQQSMIQQTAGSIQQSINLENLSAYKNFNQLFTYFITNKKYEFIRGEELQIVKSMTYGLENSKPKLEAFYSQKNPDNTLLIGFQNFDHSTKYIFGNLIKTLAMYIKKKENIINKQLTTVDQTNLIYLSISAIAIAEKERGVEYINKAGFVTSTKSQVENALLLMFLNPKENRDLFQEVSEKFLNIRKTSEVRKNNEQIQKCQEYKAVFTEIENVARDYQIKLI
jgi:hypothetical protein